MLQAVTGDDFGTVLRVVEERLGSSPAASRVLAQEPAADRMKKLAQRICQEARPLTAGDEVDR